MIGIAKENTLTIERWTDLIRIGITYDIYIHTIYDTIIDNDSILSPDEENVINYESMFDLAGTLRAPLDAVYIDDGIYCIIGSNT